MLECAGQNDCIFRVFYTSYQCDVADVVATMHTCESLSQYEIIINDQHTFAKRLWWYRLTVTQASGVGNRYHGINVNEEIHLHFYWYLKININDEGDNWYIQAVT